MTISLTYADDLSRVRIALSGAPSASDFAIIERSTDQVNWETVRGGDAVALSGSTGSLDDYEFTPGVPNYYRVSYADSAAISSVGTTAGGPVTGNNTSLTPALPAGLQVGDTMLLVASIRNSGTGSPVAPAGWTSLGWGSNVEIFSRRYQVGDTAPTVTFTGGAAGDSTTAVVWGVRNADSVPATGTTQLNASAQNIAYPGLTSGGSGDRLTVLIGWKQAQHTGWGTPPGFVEVTRVSNAQGSGDSLFVFLSAYPTSVPSGTITVIGGAAAISRSAILALGKAPYITRETGTITPNMTAVWLKNPRRPYMNRKLTVTEFGAITRPFRGGVFEVIGRSVPVAVTDLRGSRRFELTCTTVDLGTAEDLELCLAAGDPVLLHTPSEAPFPTVYAVVGDLDIERHSKRTLRRFFRLPLTEVAAPAKTIVAETVLWVDVTSTYATWQDLMNAEPTWSDVLDAIADPSDIITG